LEIGFWKLFRDWLRQAWVPIENISGRRRCHTVIPNPPLAEFGICQNIGPSWRGIGMTCLPSLHTPPPLRGGTPLERGVIVNCQQQTHDPAHNFQVNPKSQIPNCWNLEFGNWSLVGSCFVELVARFGTPGLSSGVYSYRLQAHSLHPVGGGIGDFV
jgi:hypothetical protein